MLWIKRNLFLAVGGLVALLLLGGGGFLLYGAIQKNKAIGTEAVDVLRTRENLYKMTPFPASSNVAAAKLQLEELQKALARTQEFFQPVPFQSVSNFEFKTLLDNTVAALQQRARQANTALPSPNYAFAFQAEKEALSLPPSSFPALPMQLGEVNLIANILLEAKVNALESLRRPRVSGQEPGRDDYHGLSPVTNAATKAVTTPYEVTFFSFSANLAQILDALQKSPHGLIAKAVAVEATAGAAPEPGSMPRPPGQRPLPGGRRPQMNRGEEDDRGTGRQSRPPPSGAPSPQQRGRGAPPVPAGPVTVLDENLLRIDMLIYVVRPNIET